MIETVDVATSEVGALHGKIDRLKKVEAHNEETLDKFKTSFTSHVHNVEETIQQFSTQQTEAHNAGMTFIGKNFFCNPVCFFQSNNTCFFFFTRNVGKFQNCLLYLQVSD